MATFDDECGHELVFILSQEEVHYVIHAKCNSTRQFYLYVRDKIEAKGVFVHCFTDVIQFYDK